MMLKYLLDENLPPKLLNAIQQHNVMGVNPLDMVSVGDPPDLPLGSLDPDILLWAEREGRILVSLDRKTLPVHLANHLQTGRHSPGIFLIRGKATMGQVIAHLVGATLQNNPAAWLDCIRYIP